MAIGRKKKALGHFNKEGDSGKGEEGEP